MIGAWAVAAHAEPFLQVGTGQRVLDVPTTELLFGGGARLGWDLGRLAPFVGGTATFGGIDLSQDGETAAGGLWSAAGGVRLDLVADPASPVPYLSAGATYGRAAARFETPRFDESVVVGLRAGPGVFAGFGVDAPLFPGLGLGAEVGGAFTSGAAFAVYTDGGQTDRDEVPARALFTWADLHVTLSLPGGAR